MPVSPDFVTWLTFWKTLIEARSIEVLGRYRYCCSSLLEFSMDSLLGTLPQYRSQAPRRLLIQACLKILD